MSWCFAIVNGRLSEIFFDGKGKSKHVWGHCYVHSENYATKQEQKWIGRDTKYNKVAYQNKKYRFLSIGNPVGQRGKERV